MVPFRFVDSRAGTSTITSSIIHIANSRTETAAATSNQGCTGSGSAYQRPGQAQIEGCYDDDDCTGSGSSNGEQWSGGLSSAANSTWQQSGRRSSRVGREDGHERAFTPLSDLGTRPASYARYPNPNHSHDTRYSNASSSGYNNNYRSHRDARAHSNSSTNHGRYGRAEISVVAAPAPAPTRYIYEDRRTGGGSSAQTQRVMTTMEEEETYTSSRRTTRTHTNTNTRMRSAY
ncbi:hypothetical protein BDV95DRAFT_636328 [Massariosphaeria phaeospora]|uniref:Uncharacterized protein n=1 Tax=Massariosphaeria phaeospora TaxID=100035 RepID=A0A7C8IAG7_9PLEO|nr:hypothetical protein BDV95DRAFT_636328 [Massariosphaeria phaeospora]